MEENLTTQQNNELVVKSEAIDYLKSIAGWSKFFAIVGIVMSALLVILGFSMGGLMSKLPGMNNTYGALPGVFFGIVYLFAAGIYIYPLICMLNFSKFTKIAVTLNSSNDMTIAFRNMKNQFQYIGILTIIGLSFYALAILILIFAAVIS